jgi:uncharacterized membrane protein YqhA
MIIRALLVVGVVEQVLTVIMEQRLPLLNKDTARQCTAAVQVVACLHMVLMLLVMVAVVVLELFIQAMKDFTRAQGQQTSKLLKKL